MSNLQMTETEERQRKIKSLLAIKFGTVELNSLAYWKALGDSEQLKNVEQNLL